MYYATKVNYSFQAPLLGCTSVARIQAFEGCSYLHKVSDRALNLSSLEVMIKNAVVYDPCITKNPCSDQPAINTVEGMGETLMSEMIHRPPETGEK